MAVRRCHRAATYLAACACLLLAGCFDIEQEIAFEADGTATFAARLSIDREIEDVYAAAEAVARLSGDPTIAAIGAGGLCSSALLRAAPPAAEASVEFRRNVVGNRSICEVRKAGVPLTPDKVDPLGLGIVVLSQRGPRQLELALDLDRLPDPTPMLMILLLDELQRRPDLRAGRAEVYDVTEKLKRAAAALTAMSLRDRTLQLTITAPRIVASTGAASSAASSAHFRITFAELAELVLIPEARRGKRYAVTIAY